jgi:hypothetical protein
MRANKKAQALHRNADLRFEKPFECADKASGAKTPEPYRSMIHQDSKGRDDESLYSNYTFTTLIDRFTSLRTLCAISWL